MGTVWRAEHLRLKSPVAIKFLDPAIADDPEMLERFMREAESAAAVRGTHVVQMFDCGVDAGTPYIAMELLNGESLSARLLRCKRMTPVELDKIFREVASAVGHAHEVGVIHRDLKPANIFIARAGQQEITKVLDFGIAKVLHQTPADDSRARTQTGILLGTPHYMSPEQARGSRSLDQRSDLWSLAVIAFECLTGERPFPGRAIGDVMVSICTAPPRIPSAIAEVPVGFDAWFLQGVNKDPEQRFSTARVMADALAAILANPIAPPATRLGGFRGEGERDSATLAPSPGSAPGSRGAPPPSVTLELRRPAGTITALLRATVAGLVPPGWSRPGWFLLAASLSLVGSVVIALWPRAEDSTPAFGTGARYDVDAVRLTPAEPARPAPAAAAPAAAPVPLAAVGDALPAAVPRQVAPPQAERQRSGSRARAERPHRQSRATRARKPGVSKNPATPTSDALPLTEPGSSADPFAERR